MGCLAKVCQNKIGLKVNTDRSEVMTQGEEEGSLYDVGVLRSKLKGEEDEEIA